MRTFDTISIEALRRRGSEKWRVYPQDVLPAFVAEMDFEIAPPLRRALEQAIANSDCGYAAPRFLSSVFSEYAKRRFAWNVDPSNVFAVPDVMSGVAQAIHLLTQPGAGIVINPPVYPPFFEVVAYSGRRVVEVPLLQDDGTWRLDMNGLERAFAAGARAYLLCSPHNPVGCVWSAQDLRRVGELADRYGVALISDEIHAPLVMPGVEYTPLFSAFDARRAAVVTSASKAWNIAGLKCGVLVASEDVAREAAAQLKSIPTEIESRIGHFGVIASAAAFREGEAWLDELLGYLDGNRKLLADLLREHLPVIGYTPPQATYLAWLDCSALGLGENPSKVFLDRGRVALMRGTSFGTGGAQYVRLNFGTSRAILTEIVQRMAGSLARAT